MQFCLCFSLVGACWIYDDGWYVTLVVVCVKPVHKKMEGNVRMHEGDNKTE